MSVNKLWTFIKYQPMYEASNLTCTNHNSDRRKEDNSSMDESDK